MVHRFHEIELLLDVLELRQHVSAEECLHLRGLNLLKIENALNRRASVDLAASLIDFLQGRWQVSG